MDNLTKPKVRKLLQNMVRKLAKLFYISTSQFNLCSSDLRNIKKVRFCIFE